MSLLLELLKDDELVASESRVLRFVRHVLWRRMRRSEQMLKLSGTVEGLDEGGRGGWSAYSSGFEASPRRFRP